MPVIVEAPDGIEIEFPDGMSEEEMHRSIAEHLSKAKTAAQPKPDYGAFGSDESLLAGQAPRFKTPEELNPPMQAIIPPGHPGPGAHERKEELFNATVGAAFAPVTTFLPESIQNDIQSAAVRVGKAAFSPASILSGGMLAPTLAMLPESVTQSSPLTRPVVPKPVAEGISKGAYHLAEAFLSPVGVATLGMGSLPVTAQRAISLGFATQMGAEMPELAAELGAEFGKPKEQRDAGRISELLTSAAGSAAFTTLAGKHGLAPRNPLPDAVAPGRAPKGLKAEDFPGARFDSELTGDTKSVWRFTVTDKGAGDANGAGFTVKAGSTPEQINAAKTAKIAEFAPEPAPEQAATSGDNTIAKDTVPDRVAVSASKLDRGNTVPGYVSITSKDNVRSGAPEAWKSAGHDFPEFSNLPDGNYSIADALRLSKEGNVEANPNNYTTAVRSGKGANPIIGKKGDIHQDIHNAQGDVEARFESRRINNDHGFVGPDGKTWVSKEDLGKKLGVKGPVDSQRLNDLLEAYKPTTPATPAAEPKAEAPIEELAKTSTKSDPFERAIKGEETAFDDLDAQFRKTYPDPTELEIGRTDPNTVRTAAAFAEKFNRAFAARDFDTILDALKATSDVSIWKPFLRDLFKKQGADPIAAQKAEWFRHVFNGTRPPEAVPRPTPKPSGPTRPAPPVTPAPRPKPGATPPPKPPPSPPAPPPVRISVDPIPGGGGKSPFRILEDFSASIGKALRVLRMKKNTLGTYSPGSTRVAQKFAGDLDTAAHELAGHWTDDVHGVGKPWIAPRTRSPYDSELAKFWIHGSVTSRSSLRYRRAEGIAEYVRAYVMNPKQAKLDAPTFSAYFEKTLPPDALKAIQDFSSDVRRWAGENPTVRAGLNIRMEPPTLTERLWRGITGRGFGFEISPIDRLRQWFDDPYHYAVKADKAIREVRGGGPRLPSEDFELTARLLATHDSRMSDQFERGLVPLRPGQVTGPKGELEVQRAIDPVTKEPMTLKWLLGSFDSASKDALQTDMRQTSAFMVAQRTLEKSKQMGRDTGLSGIGAGIMSDVQAARELLADVSLDPAKQARFQEAARRYRLWADQNLDMLVDAGRLSESAVADIRKNNQQYVDMHRLSEEFEVANRSQRGVKIGTARDVIKRFKGSTLELDNVYANLLEQTDSIQKEAHRNVVMNNFTDGLRNVRELHGPDLKDFDQFGTKVTSSDANTITIYKNGKAEHWKFAPEIHESLKGMGELQNNVLFTLATLPSKFARYMITRGPSFMIRNPLRDTFERSVNSRSGSKPWDIFQGYSQSELSRYETFGGGQFGNYIVDQHVWNRQLKETMRELVKDPANILLSPLKLKRAWEALGEKSEKLGRVAEFRRAFDAGKKKLTEDHPGLTPAELDYNAALYAAGEARGLLDFAKAGTVMRFVNQAVPFSNAAMRGLGKSISGMKTNPARYAMNWGLYVLAPTLAMMLWNRRDDETWKEYQQLPAYRRDFFWNLKVGEHWLTIPKPHLLGVLAGGVERILNGIMGDPHAMEGLAKSVTSNLPVDNVAEASGPLKTFLELNFNRDSFRDRDIVPAWERDLDVDLRKGTKNASGAGRGIAGAMKAAGLEADPRNIDFVLNSVGGWGNIATSVTRPNAKFSDAVVRSTGLVTDAPGTAARDVQWVFDWARRKGHMNDARMDSLRDLRKSMLDATDAATKEELRRRLLNTATQMRERIERESSP